MYLNGLMSLGSRSIPMFLRFSGIKVSNKLCYPSNTVFPGWIVNTTSNNILFGRHIKQFSNSAKSQESTFASPLYDFTFKMLFKNEEHPEVFLSMLNSFLDLKGKEEICEVVFVKPDQEKSYVKSLDKLRKKKIKSKKDKKFGLVDDKEEDAVTHLSTELIDLSKDVGKSTLDVLCLTKSGKEIAIEIQKSYKREFRLRESKNALKKGLK